MTIITTEHNQDVKKQRQKTKQQKSCRTKKAYNSFKEANHKVTFLHGNGVYVKPYECSICGKYHLCKRDKESLLMDLFKQIEKEKVKKST